MKRLIYNVIGLGLLSGLIATACQKDEALDSVQRQKEGDTRVDGILRCAITTTGGGQLDSLLTDWANANNSDRTQITHLTVSGPINSTDMSTMRNFENLDSLNLKAAVTNTIPSYGFQHFKSKAAIVLPDSLSEIEYHAFYGSKAKSVYIPDRVTSIGSWAFYDNNYLQEVHLPKYLLSLDYYAFVNCDSLKTIELPDYLKYMGSSVFSNCGNLETVKWASSMTEIPGYTFYNCSNLKFTIPDYVTSIGEYAFGDCKNITEFQLPLSVTSVGMNVFAGTNIQSVTLTAETPIGESMFAGTPLTNITLKEGITKLPSSIFSSCAQLESIKFPSTLRTIESYAFSGCSSLKEIDFNEGLDSIGYTAFENTAITSFISPSTLEYIGDNAFYRCDSLSSATLKEGLKTIGSYAFYETALTSISLPSTVTHIGYDAFNNCKSLSSVKLNEGLKDIGSSAFSYTAITSLTIPSTVETCGGSIVYGCSHLTSVFWNSPITAPYLDYSYSNMLLYLPYGRSSSSNKNCIVNGVAENISLNSDKYDFDCPETFLAANISYKRDFNDYTGLGEAGGWQTIVLPFDVATIKYGNKLLAPFGAEVEVANRFWLREMAADGTFVRATRIEANKPYIIAMPYNSAYADEYNISGTVTFSATNVTIPVTGEPEAVIGTDFDFCPTYKVLPSSDDVLVLNDEGYHDHYDYDLGSWIYYYPGGVFTNKTDYSYCYAFNAYLRPHNPSTRAIPISDMTQTRSAKKELGPIPMEEDM